MKTIAEIEEIRKAKREELDLRVNENATSREKHILVCKGTGCTSSKSPQIIETFRKILEEKNITNVRVIQTGCFGLCSRGPIVIIRPEETFYMQVKPEDCEEIINSHICEGKKWACVRNLCLRQISVINCRTLHEVLFQDIPIAWVQRL